MRELIPLVILIVLTIGAAPPANSQTDPLMCDTLLGAPLLRNEGRAESVGDIVLVCTGGDPSQVHLLNLSLSLITNITSDLTGSGSAPNETEALLLIDDPLPNVENTSNDVTYDGQVKGTPGVLPGSPGGEGAPDSGNVYPGFMALSADNRIEWNGIPFRPAQPGQQRVLRITNLRVNAAQLDGAAPTPVLVYGTLSTNVLLVQARITLGRVTPSLKTGVSFESGTFELMFEETFPSAFRKRFATNANEALVPQATPGLAYGTESGLMPEYTIISDHSPGVADTGTRLVAEFNAVPDGVYLTAPASVISDTEENGTGLALRRVLDFEPNLSGGTLMPAWARAELVPVVNGQARLLYEVIAREPYEGVTGLSVIDRFRVPVSVTFARSNSIGTAAVSLSYAPIDATITASAAAPEPRFENLPGQDVLFPVEAYPTLDYVFMRYIPSDPLPVTTQYNLEMPAVTSTIEVIAGQEWLSVKPRDSDPTNRIELMADPAGLAVGRHQGAFGMRLVDAEDQLAIVPVVIEVNPPPSIMVDTTPMVFRADAGSPAPKSRTLYLNGKVKWLNYEIDTITESGGPWLSVSPSSGRTPVNLRVSVDPTGLAIGTYEAEIRIRAEIADNTPQTVPVTLEVRPVMPAFNAAGIVNAASYWAGGVSPGELVTIFGANVGPDEPAGVQLGPDGKVSTMVAGRRILFDGVPAPIIALSKYQSSAVVPYGVRGKSSVNAQIEVDGFASDPVSVAVMEVFPGIFSADASGQGQGAVLNQDGTLNSPSNPAAVGSIISIYVTGAGETVPAGDDGAINPNTNSALPLAQVSVRFGGVESQIEFVGGAPGAVAGVIQINARVPATPGSAVPIQVLFAGVSSQLVTVAVTDSGM